MYYGVPVLVNRYPVYVAGIAPLGLRMIEIDGAITDDIVEEVRRTHAGSGTTRGTISRSARSTCPMASCGVTCAG